MAGDYTDRVLHEWRNVRPEMDVAPAAVVNRILRLARLLDVELEKVAAEHGLSTKGDFDTLAALRRHSPRPELSPTQLAEAALITTGGMTSRLDRLEESGLVTRRSDPADRRALVIELTEAGRRIVDAVLEASLARQRRLLEPLGAQERETLADLLRRLLLQMEGS